MPTTDGHANVTALLDEIKQKHGASLQAVLVYGSWLRGKRDTMLDFYVLVDDFQTLDTAWQGWLCRLLPPNVYQIQQDQQRAKYALLKLDQFCRAMHKDFHPYFWARFAQPCEILYSRDETSTNALNAAFKNAADTFMRRVLPTLPDSFDSRELWTAGLAQTYRCELRTESSNRGDSLYDFNPGYYDQLSAALPTIVNGKFRNPSSIAARKLSSFSWLVRRIQGKILSVLRLLKAAFTFNQGLQYLLWKVERHTGIYIEPSAKQLKHPLIFAWPLFWRLFRRGAFR